MSISRSKVLQSTQRLFARPLIVVLVMLGLSAAVMIRFDRPLVRGDGLAYLAWIDTIVLDQDIVFDNQFERLGPANVYQVIFNPVTQRFANIFPFGIALLQAPFYALGHLFVTQNWWNQNPDYFHQLQGVGQGYSLWLMIGANLMTLVAIYLAWKIARRFSGNWSAALLAGGIFLGTPLFHYTTIAPVNSHNPGTFASAWFVYLFMVSIGSFAPQPPASSQTSPDNTAWHTWVALGLSAGVMTLARWQLLLIAVPVWGILLWKHRWRGLAIATPVATITLLPIPIIWQHLFGSPFTVPYDAINNSSFLSLSPDSFLVFRDLLLHSPILILSFLGLPFLWKKDRQLGAFAIMAILLQLVINGAALDWRAGDSYGMRRMTELYPVYVLSAAALLGKLPSLKRLWRPHMLRPIASRVLLALLIPYSVLYIYAFITFAWTNPDHRFNDTPRVMISYYFNHPQRAEVVHTIFQTHLGPPAWSMPGP